MGDGLALCDAMVGGVGGGILVVSQVLWYCTYCGSGRIIVQ